MKLLVELHLLDLFLKRFNDECMRRLASSLRQCCDSDLQVIFNANGRGAHWVNVAQLCYANSPVTAKIASSLHQECSSFDFTNISLFLMWSIFFERLTGFRYAPVPGT